jgi:hypothetical protein
MKRLPARIRPQFQDHARDRSPVIRAVLKSGVQGQETVAKRPASTVWRTNDNRGRCVRTSGTGRPDVNVTDYRLWAPGAEKIDVHRFEEFSFVDLGFEVEVNRNR